MSITKKEREELLKKQYETCALCKKRLSILDRVCHDSTQKKLVDRRCMLLLSSVRAAQREGVTFEMIVDYEGGE
jgi:hypothetical protein